MSAQLEDLVARARTRRRLPPPELRRFIREQARLSQADLAAGLGFTRPTLTRYELGTRTPRGERLERYVEALERLANLEGRS